MGEEKTGEGVHFVRFLEKSDNFFVQRVHGGGKTAFLRRDVDLSVQGAKGVVRRFCARKKIGEFVLGYVEKMRFVFVVHFQDEIRSAGEKTEDVFDWARVFYGDATDFHPLFQGRAVSKVELVIHGGFVFVTKSAEKKKQRKKEQGKVKSPVCQ